MSSTLLCLLAERLNINAGSRSGGGGSQRVDTLGFLFDRPNLLSERARREGLYVQLKVFLLQTVRQGLSFYPLNTTGRLVKVGPTR